MTLLLLNNCFKRLKYMIKIYYYIKFLKEFFYIRFSIYKKTNRQ